MRKILDVRARMAKENDLEKLRALKNEAEEHKTICHFHREKETVNDLIDDIEIKIELIIEENRLKVKLQHEQISLRPRLVESIIPSTNCTLYIDGSCSFREIEREAIRVTLARHRDNRTKTAKDLGISIRTLRNKLNEYLKNGEVAVYELSRIR